MLNDLLTYFNALVNGTGERINVGPIEVVSDPLKTSGTPEIVTGVSCMACHKNGMIPFEDRIRASSVALGEPERHVQKLYPEKKTMDELVERDAQRFLNALEKAVGPFLRVGADKARPIADFPEPISKLARSYRVGYLDLKTVACELDVEDPRTIRASVGDKSLKQLGLDALLHGGVVSRQEWEATLLGVSLKLNGLSLMQQLAAEMRYTPVVPR